MTVPNVQSVYFCQLSTVMDRYVGWMAGLASDDDAGLCLRSLSLGVDTRFSNKPPHLQAWTTAEHGLCGHSIALLAAPRARLRPLLQDLAKREAVPHSVHGGPFAADSPATARSISLPTGRDGGRRLDRLARRRLHVHPSPRLVAYARPLTSTPLFQTARRMKATVAKIHALACGRAFIRSGLLILGIPG